MAGLGKDLVVNLAANTDKFRKGMNDAKGILGGFSSTIKSTVGVLTSFKSMLAGVAAAAGVGLSISALTGNIAKLAGVADEATKTGLSGQFLQRLGYAADQSGISAETLTAAVKKLTISIGGGNKGVEQIGLSLAELQRLSPEEQFRKVAEKISSIPTAAGRAAASMKVFGRSGIEMTGLFAGGMNDLTKLLNDAQALGIGLSDEMLQRAARADDAIQRMKSAFGAVWDQITVSLAPAIEDLATKIGNLIPPMTEVLNKWNAMPDQWQFLGDVVVAVFDLAIASIEAKWDEAFARMTADARAVMDWAEFIANPQKNALEVGMEVAAEAAGAGKPANGVEAARVRLDALWQRLQQQQVPQVPAIAEAEKPAGAGFAGLGTALADMWKDSGLRAGVALGVEGMVDRAKIKAGAFGNMLGNWFGSGKATETTQPQAPPRLAAAMARGSVEAYSTIVQAMVTRGKDPVVNATEKGSKAIVKAVKESKPVFNLVEAFGFG